MFNQFTKKVATASMVALLALAGCSSNTAAANTAETKEVDAKLMYDQGVECMETEHYANAAEYFRSAGEYEDAEQKMLEAEYAYVTSQRALVTSSGKKFMQDLLDHEYLDSADYAAKFKFESK